MSGWCTLLTEEDEGQPCGIWIRVRRVWLRGTRSTRDVGPGAVPRTGSNGTGHSRQNRDIL